MKRHPNLLTIAAVFALLPTAAVAEVGIAGTAGTLGLGIEVTVGGPSQLQGRLGIHGYDYSDRREASDIEYDGKAELRTAKALLDWHPGGGGFRLSGGLVYNSTEIKGSSLPPASGVYDIGGVPVPADILGTLDASVDFDPIVPYAGFGWGRPVRSGTGLGLTLDLGVIFQGKGEVTLTPIIPAGSPINTTPGAREALQVLLEREESELEEDIADYDLYPVVSLGIFYRF